MKNNHDFLTEKKVSQILLDSGLDILLSSFSLNIKNMKDTVIVAPVGDIEELKNFVKYLKDTEINEVADVIFVYKHGLDFIPLNLNALQIKEKIPLGTSGAFFAATYLGYSLGYEIIVVADINVFIDSKRSFLECRKIVKKENKVVFPVCISLEDANPDKALSYNVNGFAFYPRKAFGVVGFHLPYTWRGGEDFELLIRLGKANLIYINKNAYVVHPRAGYTIFHKMAEKRKFYPYIAGIMKSFILHSFSDLSAIAKFILWYVFYSFFADVFSDRELSKTLEKAPFFQFFYPALINNKILEIKRVKEKGFYPYSSILRFLLTPFLFISLFISKKATIYTDEIILKTSRFNIFFGLVKAIIFIPIRFLQSLKSLFIGRNTAKRLIYPIKPENAKEAIKIFSKIINSNFK
ncbi:MAG: hypothetical protein QXF35_01500 [Candidatus Bilamarchaeaceae archaeon]